ncbi:DUF3597 domain-containing protein [Novosphingobium sp. BL-8A]|uniref:DUF3597 domain-containing protein n=1 Tax=Novosphingobium sp. BL-8A TaxID=3127639 RepID=UPI0037571B4E
MSIFGSIKDAIFGKKKAAPPPAAAAPAPAPAAPAPAAAAPPPPVAAEPVDVDAVLTELAAGKNLDWKHSIVDLMKVLDIDSSLENRKELAKELGYTGALDGSAEMNLWLHKETLRQLAAHGGKVPAEMLD